MKANKVKLEKHSTSERNKEDRKILPIITHALPFYKSTDGNAKYFHRVRSIGNHALFGGFSHTSTHFWCGNSGFIGNGSGKLYAEIPLGGVLCATCEGRAIGAGEDGSRIINGREVMYSPRKLK